MSKFANEPAKHTHREYLMKSDLQPILKSGKAADMGRSLYNPNRSLSVRHDCQHTELDNYAQTASKLSECNFCHHQADKCVCEHCTCGRHLCRLKVVKPEFTMNSVYQRSFYQKPFIENHVNHDKEYDKLKGDHLDINSIYRDSFKGKNGDKVERPIPEDLLHSKGPGPKLSTYSSQFPGYKGGNQYVKPTDRHTRGSFALRSNSTYAKEFSGKSPQKDDYTYFNDQLKTGKNWFGKTTYGSFYNSPNPEYHAKKVKNIEKKEDNPGFNHQYGTFYSIQKPSTKTTSFLRKTLSAQPRCT